MTKSFLRGFSLVEMVLALGVASFAMVALLGLIPLGLKTSREAIDATVRSQITQSISNEIQQDGFTSLPEWQGAQFYFDGEGCRLENADSPTRAYFAAMTVNDVQVTNESMQSFAARGFHHNFRTRFDRSNRGDPSGHCHEENF